VSLKETVDEMNVRLFALEGRMTTFEKTAQQDLEYRKEVHTRIINGQDKIEERLRKTEWKLAWFTGGLAALMLILNLLPFIKSLLVKGP
jgi:collagenase-like PrtC family protease